MSDHYPLVLQESARDWARFATWAIRSEVEKHIAAKGLCTVMLTGGQTAGKLYRQWGDDVFWQNSGIVYYFGDERCVAPDDEQSNYRLFINRVFAAGGAPACRIHRMEAELADRQTAVARYDELLPESVDVLLLGVGADGHVASLFPRSPVLSERQRRVAAIDAPVLPSERLTVTPPVIRSAESVFLIATGADKGQVLARAVAEPDNVYEMPVRLALGATWLLDETAAAPVQAMLPAGVPARNRADS